MPEVLFEYLNKDIFESKAFRNEESVERYSVKELSEILFTMLLTLHLLSLTRFSKEADFYAQETLKYPTYERIYLSTTDIANIFSALKNAHEYLKQRDVDVPTLDFKRYLRGLRPGGLDKNLQRSFFYKLQTKLKIHNGYLIAFRRDIVDTDTELSWDQKKILGGRLYQQLRKFEYKCDILALLQKLMDATNE